MTGTTSNVSELLDLLNQSDYILRYNLELENDIRQNGGTVLYSYNNIIIASEISDNFYNNLLSNPNIDYIDSLPLKQFGDLDISLINQLDVSTISINNNIDVQFSTGSTSLTGSTIDGVYGKSRSSDINNTNDGVVTKSLTGETVSITNTGFTDIILINENIYFDVKVNGTLPINIEIIKPSNFEGNLSIVNGNIISGSTSKSGVYNIIIKASNSFGYEIKNLVITVLEEVEITNTELNKNNILGTTFNYMITAKGTPPLTYDVYNLPSGLTLTDNIISGIFLTDDVYNMNIVVSGLTTSDSKTLTVNVGTPPIINSQISVSGVQYSYFNYTITSSGTLPVSYNIVGIIPADLQFSNGVLSGIPIYDGVYDLKITAINNFGESSKDLRIIINTI